MVHFIPTECWFTKVTFHHIPVGHSELENNYLRREGKIVFKTPPNTIVKLVQQNSYEHSTVYLFHKKLHYRCQQNKSRYRK